MNKKFILLSVISISMLAVACHTKKLATITPAPAETVKVMTPEMEEGKIIWQGKCGKCHVLFAPESRNVADWEKILPSMYRKAKLEDMESTKVHSYLVAYAKK